VIKQYERYSETNLLLNNEASAPDNITGQFIQQKKLHNKESCFEDCLFGKTHSLQTPT